MGDDIEPVSGSANKRRCTEELALFPFTAYRASRLPAAVELNGAMRRFDLYLVELNADALSLASPYTGRAFVDMAELVNACFVKDFRPESHRRWSMVRVLTMSATH